MKEGNTTHSPVRFKLFGSYELYFFLFCLFVCFESQEQFFSYLATVNITGYKFRPMLSTDGT
jgi:hypothetical protein